MNPGGIRRGRPSIKGSSRLRPQAGGPPVPAQAPPAREYTGPVVFHTPPKIERTPGLKRVLFVCIGNSCRSQMAEGFAKTLGHDCMDVYSAGTNPAPIVQDETHFTMRKRGIVLQGQFPKGIELWSRQPFDIVVNMSGQTLPRMNAARVIEWKVRDPIGRPDEVYEAVADQIEGLVMGLIAELRG